MLLLAVDRVRLLKPRDLESVAAYRQVVRGGLSRYNHLVIWPLTPQNPTQKETHHDWNGTDLARRLRDRRRGTYPIRMSEALLDLALPPDLLRWHECDPGLRA
jgi:hypothetical protein